MTTPDTPMLRAVYLSEREVRALASVVAAMRDRSFPNPYGQRLCERAQSAVDKLAARFLPPHAASLPPLPHPEPRA